MFPRLRKVWIIWGTIFLILNKAIPLVRAWRIEHFTFKHSHLDPQNLC